MSGIGGGSMGVWEWGLGVGVGLKKELTKEKLKQRLKVKRARDCTVDTAAFTFLRQHVKGSRTRLERVRNAAKQSISALRLHLEQACAWAAELELLVQEHWQGGIVVAAIQHMTHTLQQVERQRVLVLVSAQQRLLEMIDSLIANYDANREDKLRLYWARCAVEEAADKVKHYRRKINEGKTKQEVKLQTALRQVLLAQRSFLQLNETLASNMVELEAAAAVSVLNASAAYLSTHTEALNTALSSLHSAAQPLQKAATLLQDAVNEGGGGLPAFSSVTSRHMHATTSCLYTASHSTILSGVGGEGGGERGEGRAWRGGSPL